MQDNTTPDESLFKRRIPIQLRFNDVDGYGHVNNSAYFSFYDLGKEDYLFKVLSPEFRYADVIPVIANINADFIEPILYGDKIEVETRACKLGRKSFTLEQRAINTDTGHVVCQARTIMVCYSQSQKTSALVPEDVRQRLIDFEGEGLEH